MPLPNEITKEHIPIRNVWYLLLYAWDMAQWIPKDHQGTESAPNLLALMAKVLSVAARDIVHRQMGRTYLDRVDEVPGIRGRIQLSTTLKRQSLLRGMTVCRFPELSVDTLPNRILRSTLHSLGSHPALDAGASAGETSTLRHDLREAVRLMEGVSLIRVSSSDFGRLALGRNDHAYRLPMAICELIHGSGMPMDGNDDALTLALLRDEIRFSTLFEAFIRNFYGLHLKGNEVKREVLRWPAKPESQFLPTMNTDISITSIGALPVRTVVDAKYYRRTLARRPNGNDRFHAQHVFQLYAYLRSQEERGDVFKVARGMLVYPVTVTDGVVDETFEIQGHTMRVATLNLADEWSMIHDRLICLAS